MINKLPHSAASDRSPAKTSALLFLGARIWKACTSAGLARASGHLDQLAVRYAAVRPEFAQEIRAASEFAMHLSQR
jgi:hypothetical protein